ncbi:FadR family transcriptional regulator [Pseudonocardiaceae bacterium YIM PH 21723]|nr:FadR family transcriptional regulator [Pseudonocardiaceae bacterium YIM PH 21723]
MTEPDVDSNLVLDAVFGQQLTSPTGGVHLVFTHETIIAKRLGVPQPEVHQALRQLTKAGVLDTTVVGSRRKARFHRSRNGLEAIPQLFTGKPADFIAMRSIFEVAQHLLPEAAGLCATQTATDTSTALEDIQRLLAATEDRTRFYRLTIDFWHCVAEGSQNTVYRLAANNLRGVLDLCVPILAILPDQAQIRHETKNSLIDAIAIRDGERARDLAADLVGPSCQLAITVCNDLYRAADAESRGQ